MKYKITLNNKVYEVEVEKGEAILAAEYDAAAPAAPAPVVVAAPAPVAAAPAAAPAAPAVAAAGETIAAPLPGKVVKIAVKQGDAVKTGDILVIIEAMKMENEIVAPHDGTVAQVVATVGATVESGAALVVLA